MINCDCGIFSIIVLVNCVFCFVECVIMGYVLRYVLGFGFLVIYYFIFLYYVIWYVVDCFGWKEVFCFWCNLNKDFDFCVYGVIIECLKCYGCGFFVY